jgi:hypothetical protein
MFVMFIDSVTLGCLADRNDGQVLDGLDGFVDQLAAFAEPTGNWRNYRTSTSADGDWLRTDARSVVGSVPWLQTTR